MKKHQICTVIALAGGMLMSNLYAKEANKITTPEVNAVSVTRSGSFELDMTPDVAFPLFTGPGEALWVPNWNPTIFKGDGFEKGTVWQTNNHGSTTTWMVLEYNTETRHAQYLRMTPNYDVGTIDVTLTPNEHDGSIVNVTYELTALGEDRNQELANWSEEAYAQELKEWRELIINARDKIDTYFAKL